MRKSTEHARDRTSTAAHRARARCALMLALAFAFGLAFSPGFSFHVASKPLRGPGLRVGLALALSASAGTFATPGFARWQLCFIHVHFACVFGLSEISGSLPKSRHATLANQLRNRSNSGGPPACRADAQQLRRRSNIARHVLELSLSRWSALVTPTLARGLLAARCAKARLRRQTQPQQLLAGRPAHVQSATAHARVASAYTLVRCFCDSTHARAPSLLPLSMARRRRQLRKGRHACPPNGNGSPHAPA